MARPKSMPDFASLLDPSYEPLADHHPEKDRPHRKKASISLAAGLIMAAETQSPKGLVESPRRGSRQDAVTNNDAESSEGLFYAYAQKSSEFTQSLPYIIAFASASVANEWWTLVKKEYPSSERKGPQLFILKGEDMPYQIQDNLRFYHLRNKWFLLSDGTEGSTGVIPLQDWNGHPATASQAAPTPSPQTANTSEEKQPAAFDMIKLTETLSAMNTMISENSAQIRALSVAQSEGLRRMQEINETNATQIKALAENQSQLQSLLSQNASHYIALSNSSFQNQEQVKKVLQANAEQIHALAEGQNKMAGTCSGLMAAVAELGDTVARVGEGVAQGRSGWGDERGVGPPVGTVRTRISPPPRKLNRRIKSVWYEYDTSDSMTASPRRTVGALATPPMSPESGLGGKM